MLAPGQAPAFAVDHGQGVELGLLQRGNLDPAAQALPEWAALSAKKPAVWSAVAHHVATGQTMTAKPATAPAEIASVVATGMLMIPAAQELC